MRVFLTGFMGAGKTAVGRHLAAELGTPFIDLDEEIERRAGLAIREMFEQMGEEGFRRLEQEELRRTFQYPEVVVATGGGTFTVPSNAEEIRAHGLAVWLNPEFATIVRRIGFRGKADRPLFKDEMQALDLYRQRLSAYRRADLRVDVAHPETPREVAARIALLIRKRQCAT